MTSIEVRVAPQDYGAVADGSQLDTKAVQAAIDAASQRTGGTVYFAPGCYLIGSVMLRSNVTLLVTSGAVIRGSSDRDDYLRLPETTPELSQRETRGWKNLHEYAYLGLFLAHGASNLTIKGQGIIDGNGRSFVERYDPVYPANKGSLHNLQRPVVFQFSECKNVRISGVTLTNSAGWMQCHFQCYGLHIEGVNIENLSAWNNDGIDVVDSKNVVIRGCKINCADDAICLKSSSRPVENVVISDCIIRCSASAFKCGTGSAQGFHNISVNNLVIYDTARSGIALEIVDGGTMEGVTISNITMRNTGGAIFIRLGDRGRIHREHANAGTLQNISLSHIIAEITGFDADADYPFRAPHRSPSLNPLPSAIVGLKNSPIKGLRLSHIQLIYLGKMVNPAGIIAPEKCSSVPESESAYPENDQFGELPAWGLYVRHVEDLSIHDMRLVNRGSDVRPAILTDDVAHLRLDAISVRGETPGVLLNDTKFAVVSRLDVNGISSAEGSAIRVLGSSTNVQLQDI